MKTYNQKYNMLRALAAVMFMAHVPALAQSNSQARIEFSYTTYNYDTIEQGSSGLCTFTFRNTGSEPLIITSTSASCGCTKPEYSKKPVLPGEEGKIQILYNTSILGPFNKTVVVKSNAVNAPTSVLRIKGHVREQRSRAGRQASASPRRKSVQGS